MAARRVYGLSLRRSCRRCGLPAEGDTSIDPVQGDVPPAVHGLDLDGDGHPDVELPAVPRVARPGASWTDIQRRKRWSMWNSLAMAKMVRFQVNMPLRDQLAALALEVKIELALITYFNESIPDPGENWDGWRRYREIDTRLKRLRWVNRKLKDEYGGIKGAWHWLMGRGLPTGKELYAKMIAEADDMIMAMEEGREVDILQEVMMYSGLDAGER